MDYIVLDIEFNGRKFASDLPMEVIEIGAVRLDSGLTPIDEFTSVIKPVYFAKLNSFIKEKTGIAQEEIDRAPGFRQVIGQFQQWLKKSDSFLLITWGGEDLKRIVLDTRMHKLDDSFWLAAGYFDLLKGYIRYQNLKNDVSVESALQQLGIEQTGTAHRALEDARMTAEIFRTVFSGLDLKQVKRYKDVYTNARERRMVKNALRALAAQKLEPEWETVVEHFLKGKVQLEDKRKMNELHSLFLEEAKKLKKPGRKPGAGKPEPKPQSQNPAPAAKESSAENGYSN